MANGTIKNPSLGFYGWGTQLATLNKSTMPWTATFDGWAYANIDSNGSDARTAQVLLNGAIVVACGGNGVSGTNHLVASFPVRKGDIISCRNIGGSEAYTVIVYG